MESNSASPIPHLPTEIIHTIIDEVALHDRPLAVETLTALSLVSKAFLSQSQKHLFQHIKIPIFATTSEQISALNEILSTSPHIGRYIERVEMHYRSKLSSLRHAGVLDPVLPELLVKLPSIKHLQLRFYHRLLPHNYERPLEWNSFPDLLQDALLRVISLPTLMDLKIEGIRYLPNGVAGIIVSIQTVVLVNASFTTDSDSSGSGSGPTAVPIPGPTERRLRNLTINCDMLSTRESISPLVDTIKSHNIYLEEISFTSSSSDVASAILSEHGTMVRDLTIRPKGIGSFSNNVKFSLANLPNLKHLNLTAHIIDGFITNLLDILTTATTSCKIEEIDLRLIKHSGPLDSSRRIEEWNTLDRLLSGKTLSQLKRVRVYAASKEMESRDNYVVLRNGLPISYERGVLCLGCHSEFNIRGS